MAPVGETIAPTALVRTALHGLPKTWEIFVDGIVTREKLPQWERLWDGFIHNDIRKNHLGVAKQGDEDENVALLERGKKGKSKKGAWQEAKEKEKTNNRAKKRTIPKSNVGIVKRWDTMLLCVQRRKIRKGKRQPWQLLQK